MQHLLKLLKGLWKGIRAVQSIAGTLLFLLLVAILFNVFFAERRPAVPSGSALVIAPAGFLVERETRRDPREVLIRGDETRVPETLLRTVARAIRNAKEDQRISTLVLNMDFLFSAGPSQLHYIGELLEDFKQSGKPVLAHGLYYSDLSYLIAAHADEVYLHPVGSVILTGYGAYRPYYKSAIDKIRARVHVFRSGPYKALGEPYLRDDMSPEAREANLRLMEDLWGDYLDEIARLRGLDAEAIEAGYQTLAEDMRAVGGDPAQLALTMGLVDGLMNETEWAEHMVSLVGASDRPSGYNSVSMEQYAAAAQFDLIDTDSDIGIVVVRGEIGFGESLDGNTGSHSLNALLREARLDDEIKAVVLRVDSPGGSLLASELIREEIERLKAAGKPVIASMGATAASGGYWISAPADEIWAQPTTITGSIGVIGIFPTFEGTLDAIGIHVDGVGTTPLSGDFTPLRPLSPLAQDLLQQSVDNSYARFVNLVAEYRHLEPEKVDEIGQGRVWSGRAAHEFGLVDQLGNLDQAVQAAARRAGLEEYSVRYIEREPTLGEKFATFLFARADLPDRALVRTPGAPEAFISEVRRALEALAALNDPQGLYALCEACRVR